MWLSSTFCWTDFVYFYLKVICGVFDWDFDLQVAETRQNVQKCTIREGEYELVKMDVNNSGVKILKGHARGSLV